MDWRNFGEWITSRTTVKVEWATYFIDLRIGFKRNGKWTSYIGVLKPVKQNFWNGILTFNVYVLKTHLWIVPMLIPRVDVVIRFAHDWWFQFGVGYLFDRGEFGAKFTIQNWYTEEQFNPGCNAIGWAEGSV